MAGIRVNISDLASTKQRRAQLPHDVPMERLIPALLVGWKPVFDEHGVPISYRLIFGDRVLRPDETLAEAGVTDDASLTLSQESKAATQLILPRPRPSSSFG